MVAPVPLSPTASRKTDRAPWLVPALVVAIGWASCGLLLASAWEHQRQADQDRFIRFSGAAETAVQLRIASYVDALRASAAFLRSSNQVTAVEWREFASTINLAARYPGIKGLGVVYPVSEAKLADFVAAVRANGLPDFAPRLLPDPLPAGPELALITYIEPPETNRDVAGIDIFREPVRRQAALSARDAGEPRMTSRVVRPHDNGVHAHSLLYVPVYRAGTHPTTVEERRAAHIGWVFVTVAVRDLVRGAMEGRTGRMRLALYEGPSTREASLLYASDELASQAEFERVSHLELAGQVYTLGWSRGPDFELPAPPSQSWAAAIGGIATLLLAGLVYSLQSTGRRARSLADDLTRGMAATQTELERSLRLQRAVLDGTDHAVISTAPDGLVTMFNRGAEQMLGYARDEVIGKVTPVLFHVPHEVESRAEELGLLLGVRIVPGFDTLVARARQGEADEREWTYVRKDGTRFPVLLSVTALHDDAGVVTGFVGIAQDLTERKKSEINIQKTEERLGRVLGHAECLVWEAKVTITADDWNWRMAVFPSGLYNRLLGGREPQPQAGLWYQFHVPDQAEMNRRAREAMDLRLSGYVQEFRLVRDGETVWLRESVSVTEEEPGHFWLRGVAIEITDRKRVEAEMKRQQEALLASEAKVRASLQEVTNLQTAMDAHAIVAVTDSAGRITYANERFCTISGIAVDEILGRTHRIVNSGTHPPEFFADMWTTITSGLIWRGEICNRTRTGQLYWVSATIVPFLGEDGRPVQYISISTDITERKQLEQNLAIARDQALEASRLKSEFLATMSHEIRTPMNAIIGMTGVLADTSLTREQEEMVHVVSTAAESLLTIINDILDFSRIEAGKLRLDLAEFDLARVTEETVALLMPKAKAKGLALSVRFDPAPGHSLFGDAGRVRQILLNLIGNAVKFTDLGEVAVTVAVVSDSESLVGVRITVRDTGIGISPDSRERLFRPFVQVDGSATRRFGGTGLGLAITRQLVEAMGGTIDYESQPAHGSTFWVELSFARRAAIPVEVRPSAAAAPSPSLRLLVVEDNVANQRVSLLLLSKLGHTAELAKNGAEALQRLAADRFDAVLMDCQMPVLDGYETTRRIRAGEVPGLDPRIPIIALTAYARPEDRERCRSVGMDGYVPKPIRVSDLAAALETVRPADRSDVPRAPTNPADVLDLEVVETTRRLPGAKGDSLLPELVELYRSEESARLERLAELIAECSSVEVAEAAHGFGGNAASFGAVEVRRVALELEAAARARRWHEVGERFGELQAARRRLKEALAQMGFS